MLPHNRTSRALCSIALLILCAAQIRAQATTPAPPFVVAGLGRGTVALDGPWQFQLGDDMAWANPAFDDSSWQQIDVSRPWGDQGHWSYSGHAWYRRHIEFKDDPNGALDVALYVPMASCTYEVYWNGRLIGHTDPMPGQSAEAQPAAAVFKLGAPGRGVLAFRAYSTTADTVTTGDEDGLMAVPRLGNFEAIADFAARERSTVEWSRLLTVVQILIYGQLFLLGAVVWLRNRKQKLPFWMSVFLLSAAFWTCQDPVLFPWTQTNIFNSFTTGGTPHSFEDIALWYLLLYLLDLDRYPALVRWTRVLAWFTFLSAVLDTLVFYMPIDAHAKLFQVLDAVFTAGFSLPGVFPLVLIAFAFRNRMDPSRRLVAIAALLSDMYFVVAHTAEQGERYTRWTLYNTMTQPLFTVDGIEVSMPAILSLLLAGAIVYAVYRYMVEQGQRQTALEQEHRNARAVQQVLIPEAIPQVPGFVLDSFYKPAGQVGGDFFQILATGNGGVLAVIGDVSGKGMPAAMTVSLLVGTVRTLAHFTQSPAEILSAMNQRMIGRSQGGFTTCLVLRADPDGALTVANAGHIAPYIDGREQTLECGLPLGLVEDAAYADTVLVLRQGARLTALTDGVVEAQSQTGELFGFERAAKIAMNSAEEIARAAEAWGQADDITVLTLQLAPA
ncbi:MAG: PP2C family protein-serine/threonine phosphatase [Terracidiphilus sp.]